MSYASRSQSRLHRVTVSGFTPFWQYWPLVLRWSALAHGRSMHSASEESILISEAGAGKHTPERGCRAQRNVSQECILRELTMSCSSTALDALTRVRPSSAPNDL